DGIAFDLSELGGYHLVGFEAKRTKRDWRREKKRPEKSGRFRRFCAEWYVVVPAPRKRVLELSELPPGGGPIEGGTPQAERVVHAVAQRAEEPPPGLVKALVRNALGRRAREGGAPLRAVIAVDGRFAELSCTHRVLRPLGKTPAPRLPCWICAEQGARAGDD